MSIYVVVAMVWAVMLVAAGVGCWLKGTRH